MLGLSNCVSASFQASAATKPNAEVASVMMVATKTVLAAACARAATCARQPLTRGGIGERAAGVVIARIHPRRHCHTPPLLSRLRILLLALPSPLRIPGRL